MNFNPDTLLDGVGARTAESDNTRVERIKAMKVLRDQGFPTEEILSLLGVDPVWLLPPDPLRASESGPLPEQSGIRRMRYSRSGVVQL